METVAVEEKVFGYDGCSTDILVLFCFYIYTDQR